MPTLPSRWAATPSSDEQSDSPITPIIAAPIKVTKHEETQSPRTPTTLTNGAVNGLPATNGLLSAQKLPSTRSSSPNIRGVVRWQKRNVIIQIPADTPFGIPDELGGRPVPLTEEEVQQRMQMWRDKGYNVEVIGGEGSVVDIYPEELRQKPQPNDIIVSIPDKKEWEAYVKALTEEKLRKLGVFQDDGIAAPSPTAGPREHTPGSHMASPAVDGAYPNPFSPPPQSVSAMSNPHPHGPFNPFSPLSIPANVTPGPMSMPSPVGVVPGHQYAFHLPRQSISMSGTPTHPNEWDPYPMFSPPIQQRPTPPMNGPGVWTPPYGMRGNSPGMMGMGMHGHSQSLAYNGYPSMSMEQPQQYQPQQYQPQLGLVGEERYHQQQMRRGSPLARVNHNLYDMQNEVVTNEAPAIDAPVPKHRHQLSVTLQKEFENSEGQQHHEDPYKFGGRPEAVADGFTTNPVSPAPLSYPEQPDMPNVENDVHNGPELASNPDDDVSDEEAKKERNRQETHRQQQSMQEHSQDAYATDPNTPLPMPEFQDQQHMPHTQYALHHGRERSLSQRQLEFDSIDPMQHSAMSMLMAAEGLSGSGMRLAAHEELLSEDGRTNISDIVTNPSVPSSPKRKYSTTASHSQHLSNASNTAWMSDNTKAAPSSTSSASKPKFNVNATEFKFDPSKAFTFTPKSTAFAPPQEPAQDRVTPVQAMPAFGSSFSTSVTTFRPKLAMGGGFGAYFEKGAAAFSPNAPEFTPSFAKAPRPTANAIFQEIVKPPPSKKVIPIVQPPSHEERSTGELDDSREQQHDGRQKRVKADGDDDGDEVPQFEVPTVLDVAPVSESETVEAPAELEKSDDDGLKTPETETVESPMHIPFEFKNQNEATAFAGAQPMGNGPTRQESKLDAFGREDILSPDEAAHIAQSPVSEDAKVQDTPSPEPSAEQPKKTFDFHPDAQPFTFRPNAQAFDFEFPKSTPPPKKAFGLSESRYAHTPSPPPSHPAPPPPVLNGSTFLPPAELPFDDEVEVEKTNAFGEPLSLPKPTDAELDEVIKYMDQVETLIGSAEQEDEVSDAEEEDESTNDSTVIRRQSPWKLDNSPQRMGIPNFEEEPTLHKQIQNLRSAGPSPSPRRAEQFMHHRASSFSPDDSPYLPALRPEDDSFAHRPEDIGVAKDADSDWDDMISDDGAGKLRPQSRLFFDAHVEELVGGLLQRRLEPILRTLTSMNESISNVTVPQQTKIIHERVHSDADDEEDAHDVLPPKSPRDRKLEKIKAAVAEVLLANVPGAALTEESLNELKAAVAGNNHSEDFTALKLALGKLAVADDVSAIRNALEDIQSSVDGLDALGSELAEVQDSVNSVHDIVSHIAKTSSTAEVQRTLQEMSSNLAGRSDLVGTNKALAHVATTMADKTELAEVKIAVQEIAMKVAQRGDVAEVKAALAHSAVKEDLVPLHNVLAEIFSKAAKTEELHELNRGMVEIMNVVLGFDTRTTLQEVQRLCQDNAGVRQNLAEIMRLTQDSAENFDFHSEQQSEASKQFTYRLAEIEDAVRENQKWHQSRATKLDMRRNLSEKEQKEDSEAIMKAVTENARSVRDGLQELGRTQPTLDDFRSVVESLAGMQPKVDEFRSAFEESLKTVPGIEDIKASFEESFKAVPAIEDIRAAVGESVMMAPGIVDIKASFEESLKTVPAIEDIKATVEEVVRSSNNVEEFKKVVEEDRNTKMEQFTAVVSEVSKSQPTLADIRSVMEDVISKQQVFVPIHNGPSNEEVADLRSTIEELKGSSAHAEKRANAEAESKREWQEKAIELEAKLKLAEDEAARQREIAEDKDRHLKAVEEKRHQTLVSARMRNALLEGAHTSLQNSVGELSATKAQLEGSLREAQESEEKHRTLNNTLETDNRDLRRALETLRAEMEESIRVREGFRTKFDKVQEDMRRVSVEVGMEQQRWKRATEEANARLQVVEARLSAESKRSQGLQEELSRLEGADKEVIRLSVELESFQRANAKADEEISSLRHEVNEFQTRNSQLAQEVEFEREAARGGIDRVTASLRADIAAANDQVNVVRATLEKELENARDEIDRVTQDATTEKEKFLQLLEDAEESKAVAIKHAEEATQKGIKDASRKFDRQLAEHERTYKMANEDSERAQYFLKERLNISQSEAKHLKSHIESLQAQLHTLTENFKIANVAAQAAASAAQAVAPQVSDERALRESVDVLQSQLQEREARIEQLQATLSSLDPQKAKETEGQLNMYRELLEMRIDDLEEIIYTCNMPHIDRGSLRDAATRLKASLDMQRSPPASTASSIAARLPGVATAAWATWRGKAPANPTPTPSRPTSAAGGFLNGILTPPSTRFAKSSSKRHQQPLFQKSSYDADGSVVSFEDDGSDATIGGEREGQWPGFGGVPTIGR